MIGNIRHTLSAQSDTAPPRRISDNANLLICFMAAFPVEEQRRSHH